MITINGMYPEIKLQPAAIFKVKIEGQTLMVTLDCGSEINTFYADKTVLHEQYQKIIAALPRNPEFGATHGDE